MDVMLRDYRRRKGTSKLETDVVFHAYDRTYASEVLFSISEGVTLHAVRQFPSGLTASLGRMSERRLGFSRDASAWLQGRHISVRCVQLSSLKQSEI